MAIRQIPFPLPGEPNGLATLGSDGKVPAGQLPEGGSPPAWKGVIAACWQDGDPHRVLNLMLYFPRQATPTNITTTVARCAFFKLDTDLVLQKVRFFGVGATSNIYRFNIYRLSDGAQMTGEYAFTTATQTWGVAAGSVGVTLSAGVIYVIAVAVNATGTTAGVCCHSGEAGRIGILPTHWPGSLKINAVPPKIDAMGFAQFAVTAGALPTTLPTLVPQSGWAGGMPAFFLDTDNT